MSRQIISLQEWLGTPMGACLRSWEQAQFDEAVADVFGYHALQLGLPELHTLRANRMPRRWLAQSAVMEGAAPVPPGDSFNHAQGGLHADLLADFAALPFAANSLDLVVLPHTLEFHFDPHATLREVERVLVPEGRVVISGFNPFSLWGLRQRRAQLYQRLGLGEPYLPEGGESINYRRMRDWLRLLGFEVESGRFGLYRPAVRSELWLQRLHGFERAGERWWPIFGAVYFIVAIKRVHGMRTLSADWKRKPVISPAPVTVTGKMQRQHSRAQLLRAPQPKE